MSTPIRRQARLITDESFHQSPEAHRQAARASFQHPTIEQIGRGLVRAAIHGDAFTVAARVAGAPPVTREPPPDGYPVADEPADGTGQPRMAAPGTIETCRRIVQNHQHEEVDGVVLDAQTANMLVQVFDALSPKNQAKFEAMDLAEMVDVGWKVVERSKTGRRRAQLDQAFEELTGEHQALPEGHQDRVHARQAQSLADFQYGDKVKLKKPFSQSMRSSTWTVVGPGGDSMLLQSDAGAKIRINEYEVEYVKKVAGQCQCGQPDCMWCGPSTKQEKDAQTPDEEEVLRGLGWSDAAIQQMSERQIEIILQKQTKNPRPVGLGGGPTGQPDDLPMAAARQAQAFECSSCGCPKGRHDDMGCRECECSASYGITDDAEWEDRERQVDQVPGVDPAQERDNPFGPQHGSRSAQSRSCPTCGTSLGRYIPGYHAETGSRCTSCAECPARWKARNDSTGESEGNLCDGCKSILADGPGSILTVEPLASSGKDRWDDCQKCRGDGCGECDYTGLIEKAAQQNPIEPEQSAPASQPGAPGPADPGGEQALPPGEPPVQGAEPPGQQPGQQGLGESKRNPARTKEVWDEGGKFSREVEADGVDELVRIHRELNDMGLTRSPDQPQPAEQQAAPQQMAPQVPAPQGQPAVQARRAQMFDEWDDEGGGGQEACPLCDAPVPQWSPGTGTCNACGYDAEGMAGVDDSVGGDPLFEEYATALEKCSGPGCPQQADTGEEGPEQGDEFGYKPKRKQPSGAPPAGAPVGVGTPGPMGASRMAQEDDAPLTEHDIVAAARWLARKYGLDNQEARELAGHPRSSEIIARVERWREGNGLPAPNSPLSRGRLLDELRRGVKQAQQERPCSCTHAKADHDDGTGPCNNPDCWMGCTQFFTGPEPRPIPGMEDWFKDELGEDGMEQEGQAWAETSTTPMKAADDHIPTLEDDDDGTPSFYSASVARIAQVDPNCPDCHGTGACSACDGGFNYGEPGDFENLPECPVCYESGECQTCGPAGAMVVDDSGYEDEVPGGGGPVDESDGSIEAREEYKPYSSPGALQFPVPVLCEDCRTKFSINGPDDWFKCPSCGSEHVNMTDPSLKAAFRRWLVAQSGRHCDGCDALIDGPVKKVRDDLDPGQFHLVCPDCAAKVERGEPVDWQHSTPSEWNWKQSEAPLGGPAPVSDKPTGEDVFDDEVFEQVAAWYDSIDDEKFKLKMKEKDKGKAEPSESNDDEHVARMAQAQDEGECRVCGAYPKPLDEKGRCPVCAEAESTGLVDVTPSGYPHRRRSSDRRRAQPIGMPPAAAGITFDKSNERSEGDRVVWDLSWEPESLAMLSGSGIEQQIRSWVLRDVSNEKDTNQPGTKNWGTIADVTIEDIDADAGIATVSFMSSEQASPQVAPAEATE